MAFFSIIIPTFNRAHLIGSTIASVLNQTYRDFEIIIVDDGSTDNTPAIINKFQDARIHYYWKENEERGVARNYGVKKAQGKYIFFLDSDDLLMEIHLENALKCVSNLNYPEFFHSRYSMKEGDRIQSVEKLKSTIQKNIFRRNLFACQFFLRKDIAEQLPFLSDRNLKIGEDWYLILRIASRYKLNYSNTVTAYLVVHDARSMRMANSKAIQTSQSTIIKALQEDTELMTKCGQYLKYVEAEYFSLIALSCALEKKRLSCIRYFCKAIFRNVRLLFEKRTLAIIKHLVLFK